MLSCSSSSLLLGFTMDHRSGFTTSAEVIAAETGSGKSLALLGEKRPGGIEGCAAAVGGGLAPSSPPL